MYLSKIFKFSLKVIILAVVLIVLLYFAGTIQDSEEIKKLVSTYGYFGIFLISLMTGFNIFIPIPAIAFLPVFLESGLNLYLTLFLITIGVTTGDSLSYLVGSLGRTIANASLEQKIINYIIKIQNRYKILPYWILFIYSSIVPFPNEIVVIPLAFLGYRFKIIFPIILIGNTLFTIMSAVGILGLFKIFF